MDTRRMLESSIIIRPDRIGEALEWLDNRMDGSVSDYYLFDGWSNVFRQGRWSSDRVELSIADYEIGPFCDGGLDAEDLREFVEEFACDGTRLVLEIEWDDATDLDVYFCGATSKGAYYEHTSTQRLYAEKAVELVKAMERPKTLANEVYVMPGTDEEHPILAIGHGGRYSYINVSEEALKACIEQYDEFGPTFYADCLRRSEGGIFDIWCEYTMGADEFEDRVDAGEYVSAREYKQQLASMRQEQPAQLASDRPFFDGATLPAELVFTNRISPSEMTKVWPGYGIVQDGLDVGCYRCDLKPHETLYHLGRECFLEINVGCFGKALDDQGGSWLCEVAASSQPDRKGAVREWSATDTSAWAAAESALAKAGITLGGYSHERTMVMDPPAENEKTTPPDPFVLAMRARLATQKMPRQTPGANEPKRSR